MKKRIIYIGAAEEHAPTGKGKVNAGLFCNIQKKLNGQGKITLSITGVVGPRHNGNSIGSCGQIDDCLRGYLVEDRISFAPGWDKEKLSKFLDIWKRWHLNDMSAATPEMKAAGWDELARKEIFKYSFHMTAANRQRLGELKKRCVEAAIEGDLAPRLSDEDKRLLCSYTYADIYGYEQPEPPEFLELSMDLRHDGNHPKIERKTLGWVSVAEHPDGLLGRELNGKKYGNAWYFEPVPRDVMDWLFALPKASVRPEWV